MSLNINVVDTAGITVRTKTVPTKLDGTLVPGTYGQPGLTDEFIPDLGIAPLPENIHNANWVYNEIRIASVDVKIFKHATQTVPPVTVLHRLVVEALNLSAYFDGTGLPGSTPIGLKIPLYPSASAGTVALTGNDMGFSEGEFSFNATNDIPAAENQVGTLGVVGTYLGRVLAETSSVSVTLNFRLQYKVGSQGPAIGFNDETGWTDYNELAAAEDVQVVDALANQYTLRIIRTSVPDDNNVVPTDPSPAKLFVNSTRTGPSYPSLPSTLEINGTEYTAYTTNDTTPNPLFAAANVVPTPLPDNGSNGVDFVLLIEDDGDNVVGSYVDQNVITVCPPKNFVNISEFVVGSSSSTTVLSNNTVKIFGSRTTRIWTLLRWPSVSLSSFGDGVVNNDGHNVYFDYNNAQMRVGIEIVGTGNSRTVVLRIRTTAHAVTTTFASSQVHLLNTLGPMANNPGFETISRDNFDTNFVSDPPHYPEIE